MTENIGVYACADIPYPQVFYRVSKTAIPKQYPTVPSVLS